MLYAILLFVNGTIFWLLVLNKFPFNQKEFEFLVPVREKYTKFLKFIGSFLIIYSVFVAFGFFEY